MAQRESNPNNSTLTAVSGILVGQITNLDALTGCTVVICPEGTIGGVDQRGGAPGTRETDLLRPMHWVETVNAVVLSGGSAYGLAAADGVMHWLEMHNIGYKAAGGRFLVPIVPAAILMDLGIGRADVRPDAAMGYAACEVANHEPVAQGCVGAGTGCRIGALFGNEYATKGGIGSASVTLDDGLVIAALVAVNAVGDIYDEQGNIMAGLRTPPGGSEYMGVLNGMRQFFSARSTPPNPLVTNQMPESNTVIGVVATNARLTKEQTNKVAQMAQNGVARAIHPAHTMFDGDTIFALATGQIASDVNLIGAYAVEVVARAIRDGVRAAVTLGGVRSMHDR